MSLVIDNCPKDTQHSTGSTKLEDNMGTEGGGREGTTAMMEPATLQWPGDRQTGKDDGMSVMSAASWTESQRELTGQRHEAGGLIAHLEEEGGGFTEEEEPVENHLPEKAAQVFKPVVSALHSPSSPRDSEALWDMESDKSPVPHDYNQHGYQYEWRENTPPETCRRGCPRRDILKLSMSLMTSALFFPFLVWGGYVFLPFDTPLMDTPPMRLVYTLRCSMFAAIPIVLGWLVLGVSRLRSGVIHPLSDDSVKEAELQEVTVHQRFISDSTSLFLIYLLQLVVMAMYLSQEQLKFIPLLTIMFAFGRLVYWLAAVFGSSIRGFGFGLSFLPSVAMMAANIYFIFTVEAAGSIFYFPHPPEEMVLSTPKGKQRFWG